MHKKHVASMPCGCSAPASRSAATHLYAAGDDENLAALITQDWMAARFADSAYTYDGFIADLSLAWQCAHAATSRQIDAGEEPAELAQCVCYALIRISINALSSNYELALVLRAVETGLWPVERALRVAARVADPDRRMGMYMTILELDVSLLTVTQRDEASRGSSGAAVALPCRDAIDPLRSGTYNRRRVGMSTHQSVSHDPGSGSTGVAFYTMKEIIMSYIQTSLLDQSMEPTPTTAVATSSQTRRPVEQHHRPATPAPCARHWNLRLNIRLDCYHAGV